MVGDYQGEKPKESPDDSTTNSDESENKSLNIVFHDIPDEIGRREFMAGAGAGMAGMLAGCAESNNGDGSSDDGGSGDGESGGLNNVHFICDYSNDAWLQRWTRLIPKFEEETGVPVNIEYAGYAGSGAETRLFNLVQAGDIPEIYLGDPGAFGRLIVRDLAEPLDDLVESTAEEVGPYNEQAISRTKWRGNYYSVVTGLYNAIFNWRTDIFEQLSLDPPETREDLLRNAEVIEEDSDIEARGYAVAGTAAGKSNAEFLNFLMAGDHWVVEWKDPENKSLPDGLQLAWREDPVVETLEFFQQLAEFGPDPSSISWGSSIDLYANGNLAQNYHLNSWPLTSAIEQGNDTVVANTDVTWVPKKGGTNPEVRGFPGPDGMPVFKGDNVEGAKEFISWLLGDLKRNAENYHAHPTRFVPPSETIATSEHYTGGEVFQEYPNALRINQKIINELASKMAGPSSKHPYTPIVGYLRNFDIFSNTMNRALVKGENLSKVHNEQREKVKQRYDEGLELFADL